MRRRGPCACETLCLSARTGEVVRENRQGVQKTRRPVLQGHAGVHLAVQVLLPLLLRLLRLQPRCGGLQQPVHATWCVTAEKVGDTG